MEGTSSPQSRASRSLPFARFQMERSCSGGVSKWLSCVLSALTYLDSPFPDMIGICLGLFPLQRRSEGSEATD